MPDFLNLNIVSKRLKLIPIHMDYANEICINFTAEIAQYMWPKAPKTLKEIKNHVILKQLQMQKMEEISLIILEKNTHEFLGLIGLHQVYTKTPELGIWLKKDAQGHKYGYEALKILIDWAEVNLFYEYLKYPVDKENVTSQKIAEKLGGKIEDEYTKMSESGNVLDEVECRFKNRKSLGKT